MTLSLFYLSYRFRFGFVFLKSEPAVHKIDLETFHRVKSISLKNYSCVPVSMAYTHLSGFYFIQCQGRNRTGPGADTATATTPPTSAQLLVDSVTDTVIGRNLDVTGKPYVSPDGRYVVTPDERSGKIRVQTVSFRGELRLGRELDGAVLLPVADLVFQPSFARSDRYAAVATSASGTGLLFANLSGGGDESGEDGEGDEGGSVVLGGLKDPLPAHAWPWSRANRVVASSGLFGQYLVTPAAESVFVLNGKRSSLHCEVSDIKRGNTVVWVGEV